jgi:dynein heavy chain
VEEEAAAEGDEAEADEGVEETKEEGGEAGDSDLALLVKIFEPIDGWRIDDFRGLQGANHDEVYANVSELGPESPYCSVVDPETGVNALHACAINGYYDLFVLLIEKGEMDPLVQAEGLNAMVRPTLEHVTGATSIWMAKRRGHKKIVKYLRDHRPEVQEALATFKAEMGKKKAERRKQQDIARREAEDEARRKAEEDERLRREELIMKAKEEAMRQCRKNIQVYEEMLREYVDLANKGEFKVFATGFMASMDLIKKAKTLHATELKRCEIMVKFADWNDCLGDIKNCENLVEDVTNMLGYYTSLWMIKQEADQKIRDIRTINWHELKIENLEDDSKNLVMAIKKLHKTVKQSDAFKGLDRVGKDFFNVVPLIGSLVSPSMRVRHWTELMEVTGKEIPMPMDTPDLLLGDVLDLELGKFGPMVEEITDKASKEAKQEVQLGVLTETWSVVELLMTPYQGNSDVPLLRMGDEDFEALEADMLTVGSMVASRYDFWKKDTTRWQKELSTLGDVMLTLTELQRMYSYLEPLFIQSAEVKKELPETAEHFAKVDVSIKSSLQAMWKKRNAIQAANIEGTLAGLTEALAEQEQCKKALVDFLNNKRLVFPRFYFVSEADLLDILSNGSNPQAVLKHTDKIMLSTAKITNNKEADGTLLATDFVAGVGSEIVDFEPAVMLVGQVETYLTALLKTQIDSLKNHMDRSINRYPTLDRVPWLTTPCPMPGHNGRPIEPSQIILFVSALYYVIETDEGFDKIGKGDPNGMKDNFANIVKQLKDLVTLTRTKLDKGNRARCMMMITLDAHSRDVVERMVRKGCQVKSDFMWQMQIKQRYPNKNAECQILNASFDYGYEYLGNGARLVVTQLTDRIYVTATQALHLYMGCAPAGPAGTGKTESTKDLASALGICCYVFNCSPEMDYQSLGNIFKGLGASGTWGCFDEFNRLIPEVLSVCTVQFKAVCDGVRQWRKDDEATWDINVEGSMIRLVVVRSPFTVRVG